MIKITAPIHAPGDCAALLQAGASELYCGVRLEENICPNYRPSRAANLNNFDELRQIAAMAAGAGGQVYFCANSYHSGRLLALQLDQISRAAECGVYGVIAADFSMIPAIRALGTGLKIALSTAAACSNSRAAAFYAGFGVDRIVLDRQLTTGEIAGISAAAAELGSETEVFIRNITCTYINGFCRLHELDHIFKGAGWGRGDSAFRPPPCQGDYELSFYRDTEGDRSPVSRVYHEYPAGTRGALLYCGVCALYRLSGTSVAAVKIVGREFPAERIIRDVRLVSAYLAAVGSGRVTEFNFRAEGRRLQAEIFGRPCGDGRCFYGG